MKKAWTLAVTSPQGGAGKSTIAVQLALYWAKQQMRTTLVEWSGYGSIPPMLKLPPRGKGIASLLTDLEQHDLFATEEAWNGTGLLKEAYVVHPTHRMLQVLFAANPLKMDKMSHLQAQRLLEAIQSDVSQIVVIDLPSELNERHVAALEQADQILVCALPDVISGWKLIQLKEVAEQLGLSNEKVAIVANRVSKYSDFAPQELAKETGWKLLSELPDLSDLLPRFVNQGIPLEDANKLKAIRPFRTLADQLFKKVGEPK